MAKTRYSATDANGTVHTRSTDRTYTHTVVAQLNRAELMERALSKAWAKSDGDNYDYAVECAAGTHRHVTHVTDRAGYHVSYTDEQVAGFQEAQRAENAKRIASAKLIVAISREEHIAAEQAKRVASVEATDFEAFHNLGWCGRRDLAVKLAAKTGEYYRNIMILEATA